MRRKLRAEKRENEKLRRLNHELAERLAAASYVLSRAAERNGLVKEVERLMALTGNPRWKT